MEKKSLTINAVLNILKTVLSLIFPLVTLPYINRVLQVETIGVYNFSNSIVSYFLLLAGLGVSTYAIREGTHYRENKLEITRFVSEVFSINVYSTIITYILLFASLFFIPKLSDYSFAILILSVEIVFTTIGVNWVCNIYEDFLFIAIQSIGVQIVSFILVLIFVKTPEDIYKYIFIIAFSKSASNLINCIYIKKKYCHFSFVPKCNLKRHFKPIMVMFSTSVAITVYVSSDTTMIGFLLSDYDVGLYSTAAKIYQIVKNILAAVLIVFVPRFALLLKNSDKRTVSDLFSKVFNILIVMIIPATVGLFITSKDVIRLVAGDEYIDGTGSLRLLCIAISFSLISTLYSSCVLIPIKKENIVFKATAISAVVNILLNIFLIPLLGINGAAITTIIAEVIVCIISFVASRNIVKLNNVVYNLFSVIIGCLGIILVCFFVYKYIEQYVIRLLLAVLLGCIVYGFILLITKNLVLIEILKRVRGKFVN